MKKPVSIPYRCTQERRDKIRSLTEVTGNSFQRIIDELLEELLWKFQSESPYFKEMSLRKQAVFTVTSVAESAPFYKRFFNHERQNSGSPLCSK